MMNQLKNKSGQEMKHPIVLGISAFYHDSAAALIANGEIIAAAQEERFTRRKFDNRFPESAINFCLEYSGLDPQDIDCVAFYDEPLVKLDRIIEAQTRFAPLKVKQHFKRIFEWLTQKFAIEKLIHRKLPGFEGQVFFSQHHLSHAASAFYSSPFEKAAILTVDAMGEWSCTSIGLGDREKITLLKEQRFPHSLGLLYSAITQHLGFKVNSGEYKVMGLAPYGEPKYVEIIKDNLLSIHDDGAIDLNTDYFDFMVGNQMTNKQLEQLFGAPDRKPETLITQREMDIAKSIQVVVEEIMLKMTEHAVKLTGSRNLALAGGVALNCVANGKIQTSNLVDKIWVQPAAGDAGTALGAALYATYNLFSLKRNIDPGMDSQRGSLIGPEFEKEEILRVLDAYGFKYEELDGEMKFNRIADLICEGNVIGLFQGRMEYGPRALGSRSIIGDPRSAKMQKHMNLKIKYRESFRPFAPMVLREEVANWFETTEEGPYMLFTTQVKKDKLIEINEANKQSFGIDKLNVVRSKIPAVTHVDNSARIQTVDRQRHPFVHRLLKCFYEKTNCPVLINTSFNIRGEPIVCIPFDALKCFMNTEMDYLVFDGFLLDKNQQGNQLKEAGFKDQWEMD